MSDDAAAAVPNSNNTIQLDTLSLDQLQQLQQREELRLQGLTNQHAELRSLAARLHQSAAAVRDVTAGKDGDEDDDDATTGTKKDIFIPLTESVYIPGKIQLLQPDEKELMVELGTGYFVEKTSQQTLEYIDRKIKIVDANSDNVTQAVQATRQNLEAIAMAARGKLLEIQARQQGRVHRAGEGS